jgi:toxin CcdB
MAQFDVHRTTGRNTAGTPYVVVVQSARYDRRGRRVVIPLVILPPGNDGDQNLTPGFQIEGREVFLDALRILTVDAATLGQLVTSLADDASSGRIINAIDSVITRAYG